MPTRPRPDHETLLMMLSAHLDGELSPDDEAVVLEALSEDEQLLEAFEAMSAARLDTLGGMRLSDAEAQGLTAAVLAEAAPHEVPEATAGVERLAQLALDDALPPGGAERLEQLLAANGGAWAMDVAGLAASVEATRVASAAVAAVPQMAARLQDVAERVDAHRAATERLGLLASGAADDALTASESAELHGLLSSSADPDEVPAIAGARHAGEALRAAAVSPAFAGLAARAGTAALHVLEAEAAQKTAPARTLQEGRRPSWLARFFEVLAVARAPLALAGAAAAVFFLVQSPRGAESGTGANNEDAQRELYATLAQRMLADVPAEPVDLPLLADNRADVEAIDGTSTTVVFSTESSGITVIWLAGTEEEEQGT